MELQPVALYHGALGSKFGIPRQSGLVPSLQGRIVFEPAFRNRDALRGLEGFDRIWLIWGFSANKPAKGAPPGRERGRGRLGIPVPVSAQPAGTVLRGARRNRRDGPAREGRGPDGRNPHL